MPRQRAGAACEGSAEQSEACEGRDHRLGIEATFRAPFVSLSHPTFGGNLGLGLIHSGSELSFFMDVQGLWGGGTSTS